MSEYLKIIGNWGSKAEEGRNRARREKDMHIKTMQLNQRTQLLNEETERTVKARMDNIYAQAQELSRHYRPQDLQAMQTVSQEAQNEIKSQLENYGDDVMAFMRGGGAQHLNNYRDTVLNSDKAKVIRANHGELVKYLDLMDKSPELISRIDQEGFENWREGKVDKFVFHGGYQKLDQPESIEGYDSLGEAYIDEKDNIAKVLYNYNLDTNSSYTLTDVNRLGLKDELVRYQNTVLGPSAMKKDWEEELAQFKSGSKKASDQFGIVDEALNSGFTGDFGKGGELFWGDASNWNARVNLSQFAGAGTFKMDKGIYSTQIFPGSEKEIVANLFGFVNKNGKIDPTQSSAIDREDINSLLSSGRFTAYDRDGNNINSAPSDWWLSGNYFDLEGIHYALEVAVDRNNNKYKLLTADDIQSEGDGPDLNKNKAKNGAVVIKLKDRDFIGKDEFVYIKLDMNNNFVASKLNEAVGDLDYKAKTTAETSPGEFIETPGKPFKFTVNNVNNAIVGLHNDLDSNMKKVGVQEFDRLAYSTIMAHALNHQNIAMDDGQGNKVYTSPSQFINSIVTSEDPIAKEAMAELKEGDLAGYLNVFEKSGQMSKSEIRRLQQDIMAIMDGYNSLATQ